MLAASPASAFALRATVDESGKKEQVNTEVPARPKLIKRALYIDAFSLREPVPTSLENAT